jgi:V8-like Glu-specific endopeptidase
MLRIRQTFGVHAGRVLEFDQPVVRIGRLPASDIAFDPQVDLDASGRHAEIRSSSDGYTVVDVGSRNGTLINGQTIQEAVLKPGDEIEFGLGGPRLLIEVLEQPTEHTDAAATGLAEPHAEPLQHDDDTDSATIAVDESARHTMPSKPAAMQSASARGHRARAVWVWLLVVLSLLGLGIWFALQNRSKAGTTSVDIRQLAVGSVGTMTAKQIEDQFRRALYALIEQTPDGKERAVCTAFAVRPDLLATAAHCLVAMEKSSETGSKFQAASCDQDTEIHAAIVRMWRHPDFALSGLEPSADVGVVQIDRGVRDQVALAGVQHLHALGTNEKLWLFGINSELFRKNCYQTQVYPTKPHRISTWKGAHNTSLHLIQYAAVLPASAGGSPVFNMAGLVVGVHSATLGALVSGISEHDRPNAEYTYSIRADALLQVLSGLEESH